MTSKAYQARLAWNIYWTWWRHSFSRRLCCFRLLLRRRCRSRPRHSRRSSILFFRNHHHQSHRHLCFWFVCCFRQYRHRYIAAEIIYTAANIERSSAVSRNCLWQRQLPAYELRLQVRLTQNWWGLSVRLTQSSFINFHRFQWFLMPLHWNDENCNILKKTGLFCT